MKNKRSLKQKNIERLESLQNKHPGDLTDSEIQEMQLLQQLRAKYG